MKLFTLQGTQQKRLAMHECLHRCFHWCRCKQNVCNPPPAHSPPPNCDSRPCTNPRATSTCSFALRLALSWSWRRINFQFSPPAFCLPQFWLWFIVRATHTRQSSHAVCTSLSFDTTITCIYRHCEQRKYLFCVSVLCLVSMLLMNGFLYTTARALSNP